ncbi:interferon alpha/beta receptor 2 isoform X1 [Labrus bergylta]|uniref:interferon alpha/beta receptor 2 isoform X1 n=1 Tax=Labrus bergylta TaxID=56723 RepID=UPI0009B3EADC|nr:interferon alpha/beta receptor 2-like isoform X1 [Labrus bergylta]
MELWTLLLLRLLHLQLGVSVPLPPPSDVSISSFNMEHSLSFLPGPQSPAHTRFTIQTLRLSRRKPWRSVAACSELTVGQTCNLTRVFRDPFQSYQARVQAFTSSQTSNWTVSGVFQPLTDTVFGPPGLSVSGCGNCLLLQLTPLTTGGLQQHKQLRDLYRNLDIQVKRTRDGAQSTSVCLHKPTSTWTHSSVDGVRPGGGALCSWPPLHWSGHLQRRTELQETTPTYSSECLSVTPVIPEDTTRGCQRSSVLLRLFVSYKTLFTLQDEKDQDMFT